MIIKYTSPTLKQNHFAKQQLISSMQQYPDYPVKMESLNSNQHLDKQLFLQATFDSAARSSLGTEILQKTSMIYIGLFLQSGLDKSMVSLK